MTTLTLINTYTGNDAKVVDTFTFTPPFIVKVTDLLMNNGGRKQSVSVIVDRTAYEVDDSPANMRAIRLYSEGKPNVV